MQERYASDNGFTTARLPFSDGHNPNELPRLPLPSPSHGDVGARWDASASTSILLDVGGARLIRIRVRDFGGGNKNI